MREKLLLTGLWHCRQYLCQDHGNKGSKVSRHGS